MGLLFLAQEGRDTHAALDFGRRVEQRAADVEEAGGRDKIINLATPTQRVGN